VRKGRGEKLLKKRTNYEQPREVSIVNEKTNVYFLVQNEKKEEMYLGRWEK